MYVNLVKAPSKVHQEAPWEVLGKSGMPGHFVSMPVRLHAGAVINAEIDEEDTAVGSSVSVRQGACEGPVLFLFIMQAALEIVSGP